MYKKVNENNKVSIKLVSDKLRQKIYAVRDTLKLSPTVK